MKWFDKWFAKKCQTAWENRDRPEYANDAKTAPGLLNASPRGINSDYDDESTINLRIHNAHGGCIVEANKYDRARDRTRTKIYVFADSNTTDIGNELSKIITMESLR
jgi:hypothetical protein